MEKYANKFEEAIDNCPYSTDWFEYRSNMLSIILDDFYDECTFLQTCQTKNSETEDRIRIIFFELYGTLYVWHECIEDGKIESGQLDKVYQYNEDIAFVMYSNIANVPPFAPIAMKLLKAKKLYMIPKMAELDKRINK